MPSEKNEIPLFENLATQDLNSEEIEEIYLLIIRKHEAELSVKEIFDRLKRECSDTNEYSIR